MSGKAGATRVSESGSEREPVGMRPRMPPWAPTVGSRHGIRLSEARA